MSYGVQSAGLFSTSSVDGSTSNSLRPFSGLDLTEDQRTQIRSIFKNAKSEGLTQDQVEQEIESILTPTQLATYQSNLATISADSTESTDSSTSSSTSASTSSSLSAQGAAPPPGGNPFTDPNGPFANLNLTSDEQSQISQILSNAQSEGLSFSQVNAQISDILTTAQQATFSSDLANLPAPPGANGSASSTTTASQSVQQQIAAAAALILQQIQQDVENSSSSASASSGTSSAASSTSSPTSSSTSTTTLQQQIAAAAEAILQQIEQAAETATTNASSSTQATQTPPNPFADPNGPFANLDLTSDQQSQVAEILSNAQSSGLSISQINTQVSAILTSTQQATFDSDLASLPSPPGGVGSSDASTASASVSGQSQTGSDGTTASGSSVTETDVQQQIAAAESLILQQIQYDLGYAAT